MSENQRNNEHQFPSSPAPDAPHYQTWSTDITDYLVPSMVAITVVATATGAGYGVAQEMITNGITLNVVPALVKGTQIGLATGGAIAAGLMAFGVSGESERSN